MSTIKGCRPILVVVFAFSISCSAQGPQYGSGLSKVPPSGGAARYEKEMLARLNSDRAKKGLHPLKWDTELAFVARFHSRDMKRNDFFGHTSPTTGSLDDRLVKSSYLAEVARENLAVAPNVQLGQDSLLRSPGHRANIYSSDVTHVGIGIVMGSSKEPGSLTITQVFSKPMRTAGTGETKAIIQRRIQTVRKKNGLRPLRVNARLSALAQKHVRRLDGDIGGRDLRQIGKAVKRDFQKKGRAQTGAIVTIAQNIFTGDDVQISGPLIAPQASGYGLAVRRVKDERGRPLLAILLLVLFLPN